MNDRLYRSVDDRVIAGVCGGLAVRLAIDPSLVRIGYAVLAFVTGIFPLLILYVIMAAVVPEEPTGFAGAGRSPTPPGPDAIRGWAPPSAVGTWPAAPAAGAGEPAVSEPAVSEPGWGEPIVGEPATTTAPPPGAPTQWATADEPGRARRERRSDPLLALVGGIALVGLGVYFLVRDQLEVDWGVVWAAGLMALGVVVVVAAFVRPRR